MPPAQTAPAAVYSDATNRAAAARVLRVADSPCARAELALDRAQGTRDGGLGLSCYSVRATLLRLLHPHLDSLLPHQPHPRCPLRRLTHHRRPHSSPSATPTHASLSLLDVRCHP
eukprot:26230-Prymnesium_polylepis.1